MNIQMEEICGAGYVGWDMEVSCPESNTSHHLRVLTNLETPRTPFRTPYIGMNNYQLHF